MLGARVSWLFWGYFDLKLWHISYIMGGRIPNLVCGYILGLQSVKHCFYRSLWPWPLVSFMKIYCLWGYFCHIVTQFMCLSDDQLSNSVFIGWSHLEEKIELYQIKVYIFSFNVAPIQGENSFTSQSCKPLPYDCTSVCAFRYYF